MTRLSALMRRAAKQAGSNVRQAMRAVLQRLDATLALPAAQLTGLDGEQLPAELMQHYGFASAPLAGAEVIVLPVGGSSAHGVIIASVDGRYRIKLASGEVAVHTDEGDFIHLKRGRLIEIETETLRIKASKEVAIDSPIITTTGEIDADGNIHSDGEVSDSKRSMQADREIYNAHAHPGVQSGGSTTAPTNKAQ